MAGYPGHDRRRAQKAISRFNEEPANGRLSGLETIERRQREAEASMRSRRMAGYPGAFSRLIAGV